MGDAGMWVLLAMSVVCFGALIATNPPGDSSGQETKPGQEKGPIDKMTSAVKETVADVKEKLR